MSGSDLRETDRSRVRRKSERGRYDRSLVDAVLDEALVCHLGFCVGDHPRVIPTTFVRMGDHVYVHGAVGNAALRALAAGAEVCFSVTIVDGLVLARSAFHHSMNYRSVVLYGIPTVVEDGSEKREAFLAMVERMQPGRSGASRAPTASELRQTLMLRLEIDEGSAKQRRGGPEDEAEDYALDHWAGVIPITMERGEPLEDTAVAPRG